MNQSEQLKALQAFSTPSVLNGLKRLGVRPEALETMDRHSVACMAPDLGARTGFAATRLVATRRSGGDARSYSTDVDQGLLAVPSPRFLAVQNIGDWRGPVCIWGDVMAHVNRAFDCVAGVTNGPVRDLPEMEAAGFQTFAGGVGPGGGHVDLLDVGVPVVIGGLTVRPGDILHGDRHGIVKVPADRLADLPDAIMAVEAREKRIIDLCKSADFSVQTLAEIMSAS